MKEQSKRSTPVLATNILHLTFIIPKIKQYQLYLNSQVCHCEAWVSTCTERQIKKKQLTEFHNWALAPKQSQFI